MNKATKSSITAHGVHDWCHLCGIRSDKCADIWYPNNAERDSPVNPGQPNSARRYIRICSDCASEIRRTVEVAQEAGSKAS